VISGKSLVLGTFIPFSQKEEAEKQIFNIPYCLPNGVQFKYFICNGKTAGFQWDDEFQGNPTGNRLLHYGHRASCLKKI